MPQTREKLSLKPELDLADAQATVTKFQKQVLDLQEQQRQLREKLKEFKSNVSKLSNRLQNAQDSKSQADAEVRGPERPRGGHFRRHSIGPRPNKRPRPAS